MDIKRINGKSFVTLHCPYCGKALGKYSAGSHVQFACPKCREELMIAVDSTENCTLASFSAPMPSELSF